MLWARLFGLAASSALVIGGVAGAFWRPPRALVAAALAFASGALITALAFDLFEESFRAGGVWFSGLGLLAGAAAFIAADEWLDSHIERAGGGVPGFAILAAVTLDGIPANMALGVTLLEGTGSVVLLVAIFASNLPEATQRLYSILRAFTKPDIHPAPQDAVASLWCLRHARGYPPRRCRRIMQDRRYGLSRRPLPRNPVNNRFFGECAGLGSLASSLLAGKGYGKDVL